MCSYCVVVDVSPLVMFFLDQLVVGLPIPEAPAFTPLSLEEVEEDKGQSLAGHPHHSTWKGMFQRKKPQDDSQSEETSGKKKWFSFSGRGWFSKKEHIETQSENSMHDFFCYWWSMLMLCVARR